MKLSRASLTGQGGWFVCLLLLNACASSREVEVQSALPMPEELDRRFREVVGEPRVVSFGPRILVAMGFDLAHTILIRTDDGNVVVDVSASPRRAREIREAMRKLAPGPIRAIIYTHSHLDHVGGASEWVEEGTEIWATDAFLEHFFKQYGLFRRAETVRGLRQHGHRVSESWLPATSIGRRMDLDDMLQTGARLPTRTFSDRAVLEIGGVTFHLEEAHGETDDQLLVWIPSERTLLAGDNYYSAFPNLYTIRGTRPRPVGRWIESLDRMRRLDPEILIPSHTLPVQGRDAVQETLRNYRDAIQWVRDEVVRRANRGEDLDTMATSIGLPTHLAEADGLSQIYGQIDWSVRGIYDNELGWFDGRADRLYPLPPKQRARREIEAMGGGLIVLQRALAAREQGEFRWSIHLLAKLRDAGSSEVVSEETVRIELARGYRKLAATLGNTNGRAYLLSRSQELEFGEEEIPTPKIQEELIRGVPVRHYFEIMTTRLLPERAIDSHESVVFHMRDTGQSFVLTIRRGVAELVEGDPLPGTPEPLARIETDTLTWKRLATQLEGALGAVLSGRLAIRGNWIGFLRFLDRFDRSL